MDFWTGIAAIGDAAGIPESPPRCWCCPWYAGSRCLEEVELVGRVFVHGATDEDEEGEKKSACDEDERHEAENWSWRHGLGYIGVFRMMGTGGSLLGDMVAVVYAKLSWAF